MSGESCIDLRRRTDSPSLRDLRTLEDNEFWRKAGALLSEFLSSPAHRTPLYVPVLISHDKELADGLQDFVQFNDDPRLLLLVGQYGVGKTSALKYFGDNRLKTNDPDQAAYRWIYVDGNEHAADLNFNPTNLVPTILAEVAAVINSYLREGNLTSQAFLGDVFTSDWLFEPARLLYSQAISEKKELIVQEKLADPLSFIQASLRYLVRRIGRGKIVLVLDNLDPLPRAVQTEAVKLADRLTDSCDIRAIVSVRRSTARLMKLGGEVFNPYQTIEVPAPWMTEVIRRRIQQALDTPEARRAVIGKGSLQARVSDAPEFAEVLVKGLSSENVKKLLQGLSNGSVRDGLQFALHVYRSNFIDAHRIIRKISPIDSLVPSLWHGHLPYYIVVKALMLNNFPIYRADRSWIGNAFGAAVSEPWIAPFLRIHIVLYAQESQEDGVSEQELYETIGRVLELDRAIVEREVVWLLEQEQGWLERTEPNRVAATIRGRFMVNNFLYDTEYLTHIATDVAMCPELERRLTAPAERMIDRIGNMLVLVEYLVRRETQLMQRLAKSGLREYLETFKSRGLTYRMVVQAIESLNPTLVEQFKHEKAVEDVILEARSKLERLEADADFSNLIRTYGGR